MNTQESKYKPLPTKDNSFLRVVASFFASLFFVVLGAAWIAGLPSLSASWKVVALVVFALAEMLMCMMIMIQDKPEPKQRAIPRGLMVASCVICGAWVVLVVGCGLAVLYYLS